MRACIWAPAAEARRALLDQEIIRRRATTLDAGRPCFNAASAPLPTAAKERCVPAENRFSNTIQRSLTETNYPAAMNSDTAQPQDLEQWYAASVHLNRVMQARDALAPRCSEVYVPMTVRVTETVGPDGRRRRTSRQVAAVPRLIFIRTTEATALRLESESASTVPFRLYRTTDASIGRRRPQPIPDRQMRMFMLVSSSGIDGLEYLDCQPARLHRGRHVRVIEGPLKDTEGYIVRIRHNNRFAVQIDGVCAVATTYLPAAFLQPIPD